MDKAIAETGKAFYKALVSDLDAAISAVAELEKLADARFGRDAPSFIKLRSALDDYKRLSVSILTQKLIEDPDPIEEVAPEEMAAMRRGRRADRRAAESRRRRQPRLGRRALPAQARCEQSRAVPHAARAALG